jgi:hypothetical protein
MLKTDATVPTLPVAASPVSATVELGVRAPVNPELTTLVNAALAEIPTVPTLPVAASPVTALLVLATAVPTLPAAKTPVRATDLDGV